MNYGVYMFVRQFFMYGIKGKDRISNIWGVVNALPVQ